MGGDAAVTMLRRGWLARLRTIRLIDFVVWGLLVYTVVESRHGLHDVGDVGLVCLGLLCLGWRVAVATEWVSFDGAGVHWRAGVLAHSVPWHELDGISIGARPMRLPIGRRNEVLAQCMQVDRVGGCASLWVTPSVWVATMRQAEFIAAARLASPDDWWREDTSPSAGRHRGSGSGKRVGRPSARAKRQHGG